MEFAFVLLVSFIPSHEDELCCGCCSFLHSIRESTPKQREWNNDDNVVNTYTTACLRIGHELE